MTEETIMFTFSVLSAIAFFCAAMLIILLVIFMELMIKTRKRIKVHPSNMVKMWNNKVCMLQGGRWMRLDYQYYMGER